MNKCLNFKENACPCNECKQELKLSCHSDNTGVRE